MMRRGIALTTRRLPMVVIGALAVSLVALAGRSAASTTLELRPALDGTVVDTNGDRRGDAVLDLASVLVGYDNQAALPSGEDRGVWEFPLQAASPACVESATLMLRAPGMFGPVSYLSTTFVLTAGLADGRLTTTDFADTTADRGMRAVARAPVAPFEDASLDVTTAVKRATAMSHAPGVVGVRFILAPSAFLGLHEGLLIGTNQSEATYGDGYRAARLVIALAAKPGCRR